MEIGLIFKIAAVGIFTAVIHSVLKQAGKEELAQLATLAGVSIVLIQVIGVILELFRQVEGVFRFGY
ncbi:MAG: stage III sporulation protein AC [Thermincolia bacterium]